MDFAIGQTVYYAGEGEGGETPGVVREIDMTFGYAVYTVEFPNPDNDPDMGCEYVAAELSTEPFGGA